MLFVVLFTQTTPAPSVEPQLSVVECEQSNNESSVPSHSTLSRRKSSGTIPKCDCVISHQPFFSNFLTLHLIPLEVQLVLKNQNPKSIWNEFVIFGYIHAGESCQSYLITDFHTFGRVQSPTTFYFYNLFDCYFSKSNNQALWYISSDTSNWFIIKKKLFQHNQSIRNLKLINLFIIELFIKTLQSGFLRFKWCGV